MSSHAVAAMHEMVARFQREIIGLPVPREPSMLRDDRKEFCVAFLREEVDEFEKAVREDDLDGAADALIDLTYVALGRLVEMGIAPGPVFEEVHAANMRKRRGETKRPGSLGYDATKPPGWEGPDLLPYLTLDADQLATAAKYMPETFDPDLKRRLIRVLEGKPEFPVPGPMRHEIKVLVLGYARHGKDTACEILRDDYGLTFSSSSEFCAEHVVYPQLRGHYADWRQCYEDRGSRRQQWYDIITQYNTPDLTRLGRAIFEKMNVYCGLRNAREFHALANAAVHDLVIWIDGSGRGLPPEPRESCTVEPWMADHVVDNGGSIEDLRRNLQLVMRQYI